MAYASASCLRSLQVRRSSRFAHELNASCEADDSGSVNVDAGCKCCWSTEQMGLGYTFCLCPRCAWRSTFRYVLQILLWLSCSMWVAFHIGAIVLLNSHHVRCSSESGRFRKWLAVVAGTDGILKQARLQAGVMSHAVAAGNVKTALDQLSVAGIDLTVRMSTGILLRNLSCVASEFNPCMSSCWHGS